MGNTLRLHFSPHTRSLTTGYLSVSYKPARLFYPRFREKNHNP